MIIHLIVGLIKNMFYENESVFLKPYKSFGGEINVKDDLSDYATKADLKNAARVDTSKQQNLIWLAEVDKIDIAKLKLSPNINSIDTSRFVLKNKYRTGKSDLEKKITDGNKTIPVTSGLLTKQIIISRLLKKKAKQRVLVFQQPILHCLQLKIKYLMLVFQSKKQIVTQALVTSK